MKEKLKNFIDDIFVNAPKTQATLDAKEEFFANACDKYDDYIAQGKDETAAFNLTIAGIGNINEVLRSLNTADAVENAAARTNNHTNQDELDLNCQFSLDAQAVNSIEINWTSGNISIQTYTGSQIKLTESINGSTEPLNERNRMYCFVNNDKLTVNFTQAQGFFAGFIERSVGKELTVLIPQSGFTGNTLILDTVSADSIINCISFETVKINSISGKIAINSSTITGKLHSESKSGTVSVDGVDSGKLDINTTSGKIKVSNCHLTNKLCAESKSGSVSIDGVNSSKLDINTTSGKIEISNCHLTDKLCTESKSGAINVENINAVKLELITASGSISLTSANSERLKLNTVSGRADICGQFNEIDANTLSGNYSITSDTTVKRIEFNSASGSCCLKVPESSGFCAEFKSVSGKLTTDFPVTISDNRKIYGDGAAEYVFQTVSGKVKINRN